MITFWGMFIEKKLTGATCGTCGSTLMPDNVKLRLFYEWLQEKDKIYLEEDKKAHEGTLKALQDTQEELLKARKELELFVRIAGNAYERRT